MKPGELHLRDDAGEATRLGSDVNMIWIQPEFVEKISENQANHLIGRCA